MHNSKLSKIYIMVPLALLCCFLWGSAFPMVKTGYEMFSIGETILPRRSFLQAYVLPLRESL